jgi:2',3'-cyclic-nucleotide 2'-phosphodiesterase (5'-nucleotidase family)
LTSKAKEWITSMPVGLSGISLTSTSLDPKKRIQSALRFGIKLNEPQGLMTLDRFDRQRSSTLDIVHFFGVKGGLEKLPAVATVIKKTVENADSRHHDHLVLHGGDFALSSEPQDIKRAVAALNQMGIQAQILGNFELDMGVDKIMLAMSNSRFPIVMHNVKFTDPDHPFLNCRNFVHDKPLVLKGQSSGQLYGLIGLTTPMVHQEVKDGVDLGGLQGMTFDETVAKTVQLMKDLVSRGIQRILIMVHMEGSGGELKRILQSRKITNNLVMIGPSDQDPCTTLDMNDSFLHIPCTSSTDRPLILEIPYEADNRFQMRQNWADLTLIEPDMAVEKVLAPAERSPVLAQLQFYSEDGIPLDTYTPEYGLTHNDGLAQWVSRQIQQQTKADIAFCKTALIRSTVSTGAEVTEEKIRSDLFVGNKLMVVPHVSGKQIRQVLEESTRTLLEMPVNKSRQGILQSGQLRYTLMLDPSYSGSRVQHLQIQKDDQWVDLVDDQEYTVAGDSFLFKSTKQDYFPAIQLRHLGKAAKDNAREFEETVGAFLCNVMKAQDFQTTPLLRLSPEKLITFQH